jgi:alpha-glucosidase
MNEAANFNYFGDNPADSAEERGFPPTRPALRPAPRAIPGFPQSFQPDPNSTYPADSLGYTPLWLSPAAAPNEKRDGAVGRKSSERKQLRDLNSASIETRQSRDTVGFSNRNLLEPPLLN